MKFGSLAAFRPATTSDPVLTIGDARLLRVRVDIDETDVNKVRVGQSAYVTAEAYGKQKIWGHVVQVGELLGPKTVRTDQPTERVDRKFLETLVELDPGAHLPVGLRVDTFILTNAEQATVLPKDVTLRLTTNPDAVRQLPTAFAKLSLPFLPPHHGIEG